MLDVSHMPLALYNAIPARTVPYAGAFRVMPLVVVDPVFAMIDHLKLLCDPLTSYWRLDRMLPRLMLIQRLFPAACTSRRWTSSSAGPRPPRPSRPSPTMPGPSTSPLPPLRVLPLLRVVRVRVRRVRRVQRVLRVQLGGVGRAGARPQRRDQRRYSQRQLL
jgi:hypothetical protein